MRRIVSIWLPHWPIERLRRSAWSASGRKAPGDETKARAAGDEPFALLRRRGHALCLSAINKAAAREGLRPGLTLTDARAAVPGLRVETGAPACDRAALMRLAIWCGHYGPARNVEAADGISEGDEGDQGTHGLWIDVSGVSHLFGGEEALLANLARRLAAFGVSAHIGLADTLGAAIALARHGIMGRRGGAMAIAPPGGTAGALAPLPVEGLRLDAPTVRLLSRLGLQRIGDLYGLPRAALERRFRSVAPARGRSGPRMGRKEMTTLAGAVLMRLDQALGVLAEPLVPLIEPPRRLARLAFEEPLVSSAGIEGAVSHLAGDLCRMLAAAEEGGRGFTLALYRVDGGVLSVEVGMSQPCRDPAHVMRLIGERLSSLDAGLGVEVATLAAMRVVPLAAVAPALAALSTVEESAAARLIDVLSNRLGPARVQRLAVVESHIPERAQCRIPAHESAMARPSSGERGPPAERLAERPLMLLPEPEAIEVIADLPDGPPARLVWRRVARSIARAEGPERIAPEWWRALTGATRAPLEALRTRDYYRLEEASGTRYWVFRSGHYGVGVTPPRWFMHGLFA